jgi:hypothetical protein
MTAPVRLHAIYLCLGDAVFLEASVRSIYDAVGGITIVTTYDRDWSGRHRAPDDVVEQVLSRRFDPERKIDLVVIRETSEARTRNRAMDLAAPDGDSAAVTQQHDADAARPPVDYFLVIDPDEIYELAGLERLRLYAAARRLPVYRVGAVRYFKRWTIRVEGLEWSTALVRHDVRLKYLRNWVPSKWRLALSHPRSLPGWWRSTIRRIDDVPPEVAVFHHGSYVGPRERMIEKLTSFGHAADAAPDWIDSVWDRWTPEMRNLNPVWPHLFPQATAVPKEELPAEIRGAAWPPGYLE